MAATLKLIVIIIPDAVDATLHASPQLKRRGGRKSPRLMMFCPLLTSALYCAPASRAPVIFLYVVKACATT
jgi:hypothetical protein